MENTGTCDGRCLRHRLSRHKAQTEPTEWANRDWPIARRHATGKQHPDQTHSRRGTRLSSTQLMRTNNDRCWIISYLTLGFLGPVTFNLVNVISTSSLDNYIELIPQYCPLTFSQSHVTVMLHLVNTAFVLASFGVVLSAAALTKKTAAKKIIECIHQLRTILIQGLGIFITGMMFMHFWMKYTIEVGVPKEMREELVNLAIGIQFYHAILFLSIILVLAILAHHSLRENYEKAIRKFKTKPKTIIRMREEWRSTVSYYREFIAAIGLFIPPLLGILDIP